MTIGDAAPAGRRPADRRKELGAWYTPDALVERVVDAAIDREWVTGRGAPLRVLDPACGDGRFLLAARRRIEAFGGCCEMIGVDVDAAAIDAARRHAGRAIRACCDDALRRDWSDDEPFDLIVGNPPFRSQLSAATARGGASRHGGGPYADTAVEFLALAGRLADRDGGRVALVLPESLLASRDAGPVRADIDRRSRMFWSYASDERWFEAQVRVCALAFEFDGGDGVAPAGRPDGRWTGVVNSARGVPPPPVVAADGTLGDRARLNANFRDEYYALVPAVADDVDGPPLITSGLIDPGTCHWGRRPVTFAKRSFRAPRVAVERLDRRMRGWADTRLVPKVLVANQTTVIEAVADPAGAWLPGVPVVAAYPTGGEAGVREIAAVLSSPSATAWAWSERGGTGLSASAIRVGPALLARLPWPAGDLGPAVAALRAGDLRACGVAVDEAYGVTGDTDVGDWWWARVERVLARPAPTP